MCGLLQGEYLAWDYHRERLRNVRQERLASQLGRQRRLARSRANSRRFSGPGALLASLGDRLAGRRPTKLAPAPPTGRPTR